MLSLRWFLVTHYLWPSYEIGLVSDIAIFVLKRDAKLQLTNYEIGFIIIIFCPVVSFFFLLSFFSLPNLSGRRLNVYQTSTHGVALVQI